MDDVLAIRITGPGHVRLAIGERHPHRMDTRHEGAVGAELVEGTLPHPGHDPHRRGHVGRVGQLHPDVGDGAAERSHGERDHVHRASTHRTAVELSQLEAHLGRVLPVVGGPGILGVLTADEGAVLDPGHVTWVRAAQVAAGAPLSVQRDQRAGVDESPAQLGRTPVPNRRTSAGRSVAGARPMLGPTRTAPCGELLRSRLSSWCSRMTPRR